VRPPLPYRLSVRLTLDEVDPGRLVATTVSGDLAGPARLELAPSPLPGGGEGTEARLVWSLVLRRPALVAIGRVARPAMVWGHDRVVELGVRQFQRRALDGIGRDLR
jgi:hypothetical protein